MSEVAGRMAPQIGAHFLERRQGGRGVLLGGAPGVRPARVVVLGAGNVGWNAAWIAQGMEAEVLLLDKNLDRLRWVDQIHKGRIQTLASNRGAVTRAVHDADLVIGAVLVPGGRAPVLVTDDMIAGDARTARSSSTARSTRAAHRGHPRNDAHRSGLRASRRAALRGRQRSRRGAEHVDVRAHERDVALRGRARDERCRAGRASDPRACRRREHRERRGDERRGCRRARRCAGAPSEC